MITIPGNTTSTFLTLFFGSGLSDDTYVVQRFKTMLDSDVGNAQRPPAGHPNGRSGAEEPYSASTSPPAPCPRLTETPNRKPSKSPIAAPSKSAGTLTVRLF